MKRLFAFLFLAAVVVGVAGLAVQTETSSAAEIDLNCEQTADPTGEGTKGEVTCDLSITDLPDPLGDFSLTLVASYVDVDGSGDPSPGDQLQCVTVTGETASGQPINAEFCRPGDGLPDTSPPA
jgi:hypothetical protein